MRKQYHFWPGAEGLDAWDVDRLIDMSASMAAEEVPVTAIREVDTVYWFDETQQPTVRKVLEHVRLLEEVDLTRIRPSASPAGWHKAGCRQTFWRVPSRHFGDARDHYCGFGSGVLARRATVSMASRCAVTRPPWSSTRWRM
jgi:hypothetical protein